MPNEVEIQEPNQVWYDLMQNTPTDIGYPILQIKKQRGKEEKCIICQKEFTPGIMNDVSCKKCNNTPFKCM